MIRSRLLGAVAASSVIALTAISPAIAAPYIGADIPIGTTAGSRWVWDNFSQASLAGPWDDVWAAGSASDDTWSSIESYIWRKDDGGQTQLACSNADLSNATDGSGDKILTCEQQTSDNGNGELSVTLEFRFYADGRTVRFRYIIENTDTVTVQNQVLAMHVNAYQSSLSVNWTDNQGSVAGDWNSTAPTDYVTDANDYSWVTDDRTDGDAPVVKYAVGSPGAASGLVYDPASYWTSGHQGDETGRADLNYYIPALAPGETVEFVWLAKVWLVDDTQFGGEWNLAIRDASEEAADETTLTSNDVVFAGISDRSKVANWIQQSDSSSNSGGLAPTGANDTVGIATLVVAMLAGGLAFVIRRRVH